jgi:gamma-glutamyltranspeptidase/glutathione hydrolase
VPVSKLTDPEYLNMRMKNYSPDAPTPSSQLGAGNVNFHESEETTHLSVLDEEGNAVSVTTTLNGSYGSRTVVGGAGFFLNNEMDDFSIKPGVPNIWCHRWRSECDSSRQTHAQLHDPDVGFKK